MAKSRKNKKKHTPLMAQYYGIKAKYPDAILLFRVGDFYETFGEDAVTASRVLGITLTKRNNGSDKTELAGVPHHALDNYLPKLVRAGYRVAICDQLEKPSKQKKLVDRGVTEIVTPGVAFNDELLDHKQNNYLACVQFGARNLLGLALLDVSTGEFLVAEGSKEYVDKLLQSFQPSEVVFSKSKKRDFEKAFGEKHYVYPLEEWVFTEDYTREQLLKQFEVASMKGFGIEEMKMAQMAAGAILHYVATTENTNLKHINRISRMQPERYVWLDRFTIRNLELIYTNNDSGTSLLDILDESISPMGARLLKKWVLLPLKNRHAIEARHDMVEHFIQKRGCSDELCQFIRQIGDLERLVSKVPMGKINPRELKQMQRALSALEPIKKLLEDSGQKQLESIAERINPCESIRNRIEKELVEEPPVKLDKGGVMADGVSETLDDLRDIIKNSKSHLLRLQQKEAAATGIDKLKVGFNNVFGYYFEVTNKYKGKDLIPDNWVRKQTLTNSERYISDELKKLEVKILGAEEKILLEEEKLFEELVFAVNDYIEAVQLNAQLVAQLDCLLAFAELAVRHNYCRPKINHGLSIHVTEGRHPVIEQELPLGEQYVPNDIYLDNESQQVMMITGPNMAGKSALLRQTALICLMAQMGCFVPAQQAELGIIDKVFTRVGASDNISSGESTFMVEMNETASIMNNISERSLLLLDEIGRGTSTYDGISIAWSIAEYLHNNPQAHPKTLFATHYHELNELANKFERIKNFHIATKEVGRKVIFLRKLTEGGSQHSFGIHVAQMAGMPKEVVLRANEILHQLEEKRMQGDELKEKLQSMPKQEYQLSIFDGGIPPELEALQQNLLDLNVNNMTPIECMLKLQELQQKAKEVEED